MRALRRIVLAAALGVLVAVPVAVAVGGGPVRARRGRATPVWRPWRRLPKASGPRRRRRRATRSSPRSTHPTATISGRLRALRRGPGRGSGRWSGSPAKNFVGYGLRVAPDGTALAVWRAVRRRHAHVLLVRAPARRGVGSAAGDRRRRDVTASSSRSATEAPRSPRGGMTRRPASGRRSVPRAVRGACRSRSIAGRPATSVAMSAAGDAVVVWRAPAPGDVWRDTGLPVVRGAAIHWCSTAYFDKMRELMAEFDGRGAPSRSRSIASSITRFASTSAAPARRAPGARPTRSSTMTATTRRLRTTCATWTRWFGTRRARSWPGRAGRRRRVQLRPRRLASQRCGWDTPKVFDFARIVSTARRQRPMPQAKSCSRVRAAPATAKTSARRSRPRSRRPGRT